jgi:hypothetical protein
MEKHTLRICHLCFLSIFFIGRAFGQAASADSVNLQPAVSHFYKSIGEESRLYNGHEYLPYDPQIKSSALFPYDAKTWATGNINYDDIVYRNVPMMYDVYKDAVIVLLYNKFSMFSLLSERVHDFTFSNHRFIRLDADQISDNKLGLATGFYEQLYAGKIEILAKRSKSLQSTVNTIATPETYFHEKNNYYLKKGNAYYKIGSKGSVLKILKDKKSELQKFLKQNSIHYGDDPEDAMAKMASYYDNITN